jgi:hypothetical protein
MVFTDRTDKWDREHAKRRTIIQTPEGFTAVDKESDMTNARGLPEDVKGTPTEEWLKNARKRDARRRVESAMDNLVNTIKNAEQAGLKVTLFGSSAQTLTVSFSE